MNEKTVTITENEYKALVRDAAKLAALEAHGVDNWEWYDEAMEDFYATEEEE